MAQYDNFDRQYRVSAGPAGGGGFEIGAASDPDHPVVPHIEFNCEKTDCEAQNTGKLSIWNLSPEHLAVLNEKDCAISLRAGYGNSMPLIFAGIISFSRTVMDGADRKTEIEVVDNLLPVRDTYVSVSYQGKVNWKTILDDVAAQMGVAITYSYNATFVDINNGFSYVGLAKEILTKGCECCRLTWSIQNGVLQIKRPGDVMQREVYVLSAVTGLINIPVRILIEENTTSKDEISVKQYGWEVEYFLNGAIGIDDYVMLDSKYASGYFRVHKLSMTGDNASGDWLCKAELLELTA